MKKRIVSLLIVVVLIISSSITSASAQETSNKPTSTNMDILDVLVASTVYLKSDINNEDLLPENSYCKEIIPLYNIHNEIVAYYITFTSSSYAVVNNNINNPIVIEFGEGDNHLISEIMNSNTNPHIIYNSPFDIYNKSEVSTNLLDSADSKDLFDYYPDLTENNVQALTLHDEIKSKLFLLYPMLNLSKGDGDYGFIDLGGLPSGSYSAKTISSASSVNWATTGEFSNIANNHCAAVAVTNLALYFAKRGSSNLMVNNSKTDTFKAVHAIVGNGPVMIIAGSAKTYFKNRGYTLNYTGADTISSLKTATDNNRPCGILLADGIVDWHWIISVGYRTYSSSGDTYVQIVNGWNNTIQKYYKPHSGSMWWSATQYY